MSARFRVGECGGWAIVLPVSSRGGGYTHPTGFSVVVTDTLICHRVVAEYRSEDKRGGFGREGIRRKAADLAAELNAEHEAFLAGRAA